MNSGLNVYSTTMNVSLYRNFIQNSSRGSDKLSKIIKREKDMKDAKLCENLSKALEISEM